MERGGHDASRGRRGRRLPPAGLALLGALALTVCGATGGERAGALSSIRFTGGGFHAVELDGYGLAVGPHWPLRDSLPAISPDLPEYYRRNGTPIAYVRGSVPEAEVEARVPADWRGDVRVRAAGPDLVLAGTGTAEGGRLTAAVSADRPLPDAIAALDPLRLTWTAEHGDERVRLGVSRNALYVLLAEPVGPLLHTPLHIAAERAAGMTDPRRVIAAVWREFIDRRVHRARDGRTLRYYGGYGGTAPAELRRMLIAGFGQCVAWSYLFHTALAAHGIEAEITLVAPPDRGRIYVGRWRFAAGRRFIDTGDDGVAQTAARGDDVAIIEPGRGRPHARVWTAPERPIGPLAGDDEGSYMVGPNGLADTRVEGERAIRILPRGFGLPNQRAYQLAPDADADAVRLGGDDRIATHIDTRYVLTGPNGILETGRQPAFRAGSATGSRWEPTVGRGATSIHVAFALPRGDEPPEARGDDRMYGWWLDAGADGVSDTPGAHEGRGAPHAVAVAAGPDGELDSEPAGDDVVRDLSPYLELAPPGYEYVDAFTIWPLPAAGGQSNPRPPPDYPNHVIVKVDGRYYDPSYGTGPFESQLEWERASLAGVGVRIQRDGENVRFEGRIIMVVRRADGTEPLTSFIRMLPPD